MKQEHICCVIGHQPANLPFGSNESDERCIRLKKELREAIENQIQDGFDPFPLPDEHRRRIVRR